MKVRQLSVFLENRSGRMARVTRLLGDAGINIRALSIADTADFGILRLIVNDPDRAAEVLRSAGFSVRNTDVVAIEVPDRPGGLAGVLEALGGADINVEYLYAFVGQSEKKAVVVFRFEDTARALEVLDGLGVKALDAATVYAL